MKLPVSVELYNMNVVSMLHNYGSMIYTSPLPSHFPFIRSILHSLALLLPFLHSLSSTFSLFTTLFLFLYYLSPLLSSLLVSPLLFSYLQSSFFCVPPSPFLFLPPSPFSPTPLPHPPSFLLSPLLPSSPVLVQHKHIEPIPFLFTRPKKLHPPLPKHPMKTLISTAP